MIKEEGKWLEPGAEQMRMLAPHSQQQDETAEPTKTSSQQQQQQQNMKRPIWTKAPEKGAMAAGVEQEEEQVLMTDFAGSERVNNVLWVKS